MTRTFLAAFYFAVLALFFSRSISTAQGLPDVKPVFEQINTEVLAHSGAYTRLRQSIERVGHRLTGSVNGTAAEQVVFDLLKQDGLDDMSCQACPGNGWMREHVDVRS